MDPEIWLVWLAFAAALIAAVALYFNRQSTRAAQRAAKAAEDQTEIQRQLRIDAAQPYVWVDIRGDDAVGTILHLVIGNSGPTVATNVRIEVEPPLPAIEEYKERIEKVGTLLADGVQSLTPGRELRWVLGQGFALLNDDRPQAYTFTVNADGPFGAVPTLTYVVDMSDWRQTHDRPAGSIHQLTLAVKELTKRTRPHMIP